MSKAVSRRDLVRAMGTGAALICAPALVRSAGASEPLKIAVFNPESGPGALFGPAGHDAAILGADAVNAQGGILGRRVEVIFSDAGVSPAEATKSVTRLLLSEKVDLIIGAHDGAVRHGLEAAIRGRVPYIFTPVHEGGDCTASTFYLGETPEQQIGSALPKLIEIARGKSFYLIGNDYVWPHTTNARAKELIAKLGGTVVSEDYYPLGAANSFTTSVQKIKSAAPAIVLQTLVGGDNVNFNRTFADFGLSDSMVRLSCLLEENTLAGIGKDAANNLYSCLDYFSSIDSPANKTFLEALKAKAAGKPPIQGSISEGLYSGFIMAAAVAAKAGSVDAATFSKAAEQVSFDTPGGPLTVSHRHTDKTMYLARCDGGVFTVVETFANVKTGQTCS